MIGMPDIFVRRLLETREWGIYYHGTSFYNLASIIDNDKICCSYVRDDARGWPWDTQTKTRLGTPVEGIYVSNRTVASRYVVLDDIFAQNLFCGCLLWTLVRISGTEPNQHGHTGFTPVYTKGQNPQYAVRPDSWSPWRSKAVIGD